MFAKRVALLTFLAIQGTVGFRLTAPGAVASSVLSASDITYLGAFRTTSATDLGHGGMAGRTVGGEQHFFLYKTHSGSASGAAALSRIDAVTSTTVFTVQAGYGSQWSVGMKINVKRSATGLTGLPTSTVVTNVATDTITVSPALAAAPRVSVSTTVASGASGTVFTVAAGLGASFAVGDEISVSTQNSQVTGVSGDQLTVSPSLGFTPVAGYTVGREDWAYSDGDHVIEYVDPTAASCNTGTYGNPYTGGGIACVYRDWGDIYNGRRVTWVSAQNGAIDAPVGNVFPDGLYWNAGFGASGGLCATYANAYNNSGNHDWSLLCATLDNVGTGATTTYGPWRTAVTNGDGATAYGLLGCNYMGAAPDGSFMCGASLVAGNSGSPWGPSLYAGLTFPTTATPCCPAGADLTVPDRYLNYYFMGDQTSPNYINNNGSIHGALRSARRVTSQAPQEYYGLSPMVRVDPAQNSGVGSWSDLDGTGGAVWLELTNKHGVLFNTQLAGAASQDTNDCTIGHVGHEWYMSRGYGLAAITPGNGSRWKDVSGTYNGPGPNGSFDGIIGTATAVGNTLTYVSGDHFPTSPKWLLGDAIGINNIPGYHVASITSSTVMDLVEAPPAGLISWGSSGGACAHGCMSDTYAIQGPITYASFPGLWIYDPDDLTAVKGGSKVDYTVNPLHEIDLVATYGIHTAPVTFPGVGTMASSSVWDASRKYLFLLSSSADSTTTPGLNLAIIHAFAVADNPAPSPLPLLSVLLVLSAAAMLVHSRSTLNNSQGD